ncbi:hypothetical protein F5Y19DRAFT_435969 [Xylariaceae sp. FL1651]|nr:hypothetical protein F5Y19DRAFT_435969 [Xylariaceae sp. FL1651]
MEWISQSKKLLRSDYKEFIFRPGQECLIQTIRLLREDSGTVALVDEKTHRSDLAYLEWIKQLPSWTEKPAVVLVMHQRLDGEDAKATSLPYRQETFDTACEHLFQHRSVADALRRTSPAIFTSRMVTAWKQKLEWGPAIVYNCKSDTVSTATGDDMVLSVTHFPNKPMIFAVVYGCNLHAREFIGDWFKYGKASGFDPLLLPMMFFELERRRLLDAIEPKESTLWNRINHMENKLRLEEPRDEPFNGPEKSSIKNEITQGECENVNMWAEVGLLSDGLVSFKTQLTSMLQNSISPLENDILSEDAKSQLENDILPEDAKSQLVRIRKHSSNVIQTRLHAMIAEIDSVVRRSQSILRGMTLATQTESNYLSREEASISIRIAVLSQRDSTLMRHISYVGMIFLPGTFFATLFSMGFFNWIPQESNQMISPWILIYFGLTLLSTATAIWHFETRKNKGNNTSTTQTQVDTQVDGWVNQTPPSPLESVKVG